MGERALSWGDDLRAVRLTVGLSREALARIAGVSAATVKSYEDGSRNPSRLMLASLLDAMRVERHARNGILVGAGFAPDGEFLGPGRFPGYFFSEDEAQQHVDEMPWPSFVFNDVFEVFCANELTERVWGVDLEREFRPGIARNMLGVASWPRFTERCENWDDLARFAIALMKGHHRGPEELANLSPYFSEVMERFSRGDQRYISRFLDLWQETLPNDPKARLTYSAIFNLPDIGRMTFRCLVTTCNEPEGLAFNDWIPMNAETWEALEKLRESRPEATASNDVNK